ncbi:alpha/beta fold hydrolase [Mycolicibacterium psychrotolerans]|uniref:alpha/beta fold hydrolase n=1 Tax=Mycolicibacterium psychrotolerans TaxID=216929 RepID=UPI003D672189
MTRRLAGLLARTAWFRWAIIDRFWDERHAAQNDDYHDDARLNSGAQLAHISVASAGFTLPEGLDKSNAPTLFLSGGKELRLIHRVAAMLAKSMPNGVDQVAADMDHDWTLGNPDLFSRTVDAWFSGDSLPPEIGSSRP